MVNLSGEIGKQYMIHYIETHAQYVNHIMLTVFSQMGNPSWKLDPNMDDLACELAELSLTSNISELFLHGDRLVITTTCSQDGSTNIDANVIDSIVSTFSETSK